MSKTISILAVGVLLGFFVAKAEVLKSAFGAGGKKCDYTYFQDLQAPEIGEEGVVKYDEVWKKVLDAGWTLKFIEYPKYFFEKCQ